MNTFKFIGRINTPNQKTDIIKKIGNSKCLKFLIKQNENNSAYVQMYSDKLINGCIPVYQKDSKGRKLIKFEDRFNLNLLKDISYASKYRIIEDKQVHEFIWKEDFMDVFYEMLLRLPKNTIYQIDGEFIRAFYNGKFYNNFNIKSIKVNNFEKPELRLNIELFYNKDSFDETDKRNKFILNAYVEQYDYSEKEKKFVPIKVQFITNRFNFKNIADVEIIRHRKANMNPREEDGYVKAIWEAQYVRGAQMITPPLETLPKDIQFEIKNAGRELKEYMNNVIGTAAEFICLTRPDNTKNKNGAVYIPLGITEEEFKNKINNFGLKREETLDRLAEKDAYINPFN